jgi:hypothetical protein
VSAERFWSGKTASERIPGAPAPASIFPPHQPSTASTTTAAAASAARRFRAVRGRRAWTAMASAVLARVSASANSWVVPNRFAGVRPSALLSVASTPVGTASRTTEMHGSGSLSFFARIACGVGPVYGVSPVNISYRTQPSE